MSNKLLSVLCASYSAELIGPAFKNAASVHIGGSAAPDNSAKLSGPDFEI